jgi:uncharacterized membrane protein
MIDLHLVAQQTLTLDKILSALKPGDFWGWLCYLVIALNIITLVLIKESNVLLTILMAIGIVAALINELGANRLQTGVSGLFGDILVTNKLPNWLLGIAMVVAPLVVAGMTKTGRARLPAILSAIFATIFVFGRWMTLPK